MNTRNSRFNQRRMQTLAFLGSEDQNVYPKVNHENLQDDTFGLRDEDWDLYKEINRELDSDEENIELKLQEIELELKELDQRKML